MAAFIIAKASGSPLLTETGRVHRYQMRSIYKSENLSYSISNNMLSTAGLKGDSTKLSNNRITKKGAKFINPTLVMRG